MRRLLLNMLSNTFILIDFWRHFSYDYQIRLTEWALFSLWCICESQYSVLWTRMNLNAFMLEFAWHVCGWIYGIQANWISPLSYIHCWKFMPVHKISAIRKQMKCIQVQKQLCFNFQRYRRVHSDGTEKEYIKRYNKNKWRLGENDMIKSMRKGTIAVFHSDNFTFVQQKRTDITSIWN